MGMNNLVRDMNKIKK